MTALTPGLAALLDTSLGRFEADQAKRDAGIPVRQETADDQLALFDVSEDGDTLVSFDGQTL